MRSKNLFKKKLPFIVAEIGNNHEGSPSVARKLINEAYNAGADAVKFQTFITEDFISKKEKKRFNRFKKFQLSQKNFINLANYTKKKGMKFISTPLDIKSAIFLNSIVDSFKISSGDNNYFELIKKVLSFKKPVIISTGFLNFREIKLLLKFIKKNKFPLNKLTLLHCVSDYPVKDHEASLNSIKFLKDKLNINIGYSDHTIGITASIIATIFGAEIIEKHFTLDKKYSNFRDHSLSSDPMEMKDLVNSIRRIKTLSGSYEKKISLKEKKNLTSSRRSIYAAIDINKNQKINYLNTKILRPGNGLEPNKIETIKGKKSKKIIKKNDLIKL